MALSAELEGFEARHGKFREMNVFLFVMENSVKTSLETGMLFFSVNMFLGNKLRLSADVLE